MLVTSDAQVRYRKRKRGPQPVACVGCREWIFSENSGALASFAAATEFTFGTIVQVGTGCGHYLCQSRWCTTHGYTSKPWV